MRALPLGFGILIAAGALMAVFLVTEDVSGEDTLHTTLEVVAALLAAGVAAIAAMRYRSRRDALVLFVCLGFLGSAILDGYHAIVTSTWFAQTFPASAQGLLPWSWFGARVFLSVYLFFGILMMWTQARRAPSRRVVLAAVWMAVGLTAISLFLVTLFPLPDAYRAGTVHRPQEWLPLAFFAGAFALALRGTRQDEAMQAALVTALVLGMMTQGLMLFAGADADPLFLAAHGTKVLSYLAVYLGATWSGFRLFQEAEAARRAQQLLADRFTDLFGRAPIAYFAIGTDRRVKLANERAGMLFDCEPASLIGRDVLSLYAAGPHGQERALACFHRFQRGEAFTDVELEIERQSGQRRWVSLSVHPVYDADGMVVESRSAMVDITDRKRMASQLEEQAEELQRSNKDLEQFAYIASHDLRAPLRHVAGFAELMEQRLQDTEDEKVRMYLGRIRAAIHSMESLIDSLLVYSRVGRAAVVPQRVPLGQLVEDAERALEGAIAETGADVRAEGLPVVYASPDLFARVVQNLLHNAIKYRHPDRKPIIEITAEDRGDHVEVVFADNGQGFEQKHAERIFEMFQRLVPKAVEGTGIGLAVTRTIIERHGGTIRAEGRPGEGARFIFTLPKYGVERRAGLRQEAAEAAAGNERVAA